MAQRTILITGANRGIGFEIARQSGKAGLHVILSGRDEKRLDEALKKLHAENIAGDKLLMDVSDAKSITAAAKDFSSRFSQLDVLVNNAGIGLKNDNSLLHSDEEIFQQTLLANSYGPLRVTKAFLQFMKSGSRIIMISSGGGSMTDEVGGWWPAYCVSKSLLNAITRHLAYELSGKNIAVNAVCPGWVRTDMGGRGAPRSVEHGAETPVWLATEAPQSVTGKFLRDKKVIPW